MRLTLPLRQGHLYNPTMSDDRASLQERISGQLDTVRVVGLQWLDTRKQATRDLSLLETAAETVSGYQPRLTRTAKIDLLLRHEIDLMMSCTRQPGDSPRRVVQPARLSPVLVAAGQGGLGVKGP